MLALQARTMPMLSIDVDVMGSYSWVPGSFLAAAPNRSVSARHVS